jgi:branched-chain amino acid transport system substrate-binding protein
MRGHIRALVAATAVLALAVAAGCAGSEDESGDLGDSVTLGLIAPTGGVFADIGADMKAGAELAAKHVNEDGGIGEDGTEISIETKDEGAGEPEVATQALRDFMLGDQKLTLGLLSSADCLAAAPLADQLGGVLVGSVCSGDELTGADRKGKSFFGMAARDETMAFALADVLAEKFPAIRDLYVFGFDYVVGRELPARFETGLKDHGVDFEVADETYVPLDQQNYRPEVAGLAGGLKGQKDARALFLSTYGGGTAAFLQQAEAFDLVDQFAYTAQVGGYYTVARSLEGRAPDVWNAYDYFYDAYDSEANQRFVEEFESEYKRKPDSWAYLSYVSVLAYAGAIEKAGSAAPDEVAKALEGLSFDGPAGEITIDPQTHQADGPVTVTNTVGDPNAPEGVKLLDSTSVQASAED